MRYVCLIAVGELLLLGLSPCEAEALSEESLAYTEALQQSGHLLAAQVLQPVQAATTVRVRSARLAVSEGPFAETDEQLCGFMLIEAIDLNDAIQLASKIPLARLGSVEVRPVAESPRNQGARRA